MRDQGLMNILQSVAFFAEAILKGEEIKLLNVVLLTNDLKYSLHSL